MEVMLMSLFEKDCTFGFGFKERVKRNECDGAIS